MPNDVGAPNALAELSARERMVAIRFADGMTYREIGQALFIAPATVRAHLSSIYQKLGVGSKIALARVLAGQPLEKTIEINPSQPIQARDGAPLVAILPFDTLTPNERWEHLADGISANIITALARYSHISVTARQTTLSFKGRRDDARSIGRELNADYVLEGSLQASKKQVRIWVQLTDTESGGSLWAARYDEPVDNHFTIQDSVTSKVVSVLGGCYGKFMQVRRDAARRKPQSSVGAYDCYLLGVEQLDLDTRSSTEQAVRLLSKAVSLDPSFSRAWSRLGFAYHSEAYNAYGADPSASLRRSISCAEKALFLDPDDMLVRQAWGCQLALKGDLKRADEENSRALASAPTDSMTLALVAECRVLVSGNPHEGCELIKRAISLNPNTAPRWYFDVLGGAHFVTGGYQESVEAYCRGIDATPSALMFRAMAYAMADDSGHAAQFGAILSSEFPDFTVEGFVHNYPVTNPPALAAVWEGARRAGLN